MSSRELPGYTSPELETQMCAATSGFYMGAEDLNSDPHACLAGTLSSGHRPPHLPLISAFYVVFFLFSQYAEDYLASPLSSQPRTLFYLTEQTRVDQVPSLPSPNPGERKAAGYTSRVCPHLLLGSESETTGLVC